ncbi:hypothetical protein L873DRAFT_400129 [Choiromyces venosus 120613-1]|uniref:Uncharacterized protein n=1 Tax=Choiromyces venosus 120613-1 TaxID=1336337 RepID=A0A3N4J2F7_9PEZI|nr:hypothetical protein L873DRAFT_400129 [Choiromyces venosus 120613-1]
MPKIAPNALPQLYSPIEIARNQNVWKNPYFHRLYTKKKNKQGAINYYRTTRRKKKTPLKASSPSSPIAKFPNLFALQRVTGSTVGQKPHRSENEENHNTPIGKAKYRYISSRSIFLPPTNRCTFLFFYFLLEKVKQITLHPWARVWLWMSWMDGWMSDSSSIIGDVAVCVCIC